MVIKRRQRKPLRSELSDGIRKTRKTSAIQTIPAPEITAPVVKEPTVEVIVDTSPISGSIDNDENLLEKEDVSDSQTNENESFNFDGSSEVISSTEEEALRQKARDLGIKNWWNKKIESLLVEIEQLQGE